MKSVYFRLKEEDMLELKWLAEKQNRSVPNLVAVLIKKYIAESRKTNG